MNTDTFGQTLKDLRKKSGISSKVLSTKVGKAVTYVSQLERELIKNPSYETCLEILNEIGLSNDEALKILSYYGIQSKEEKEAEISLAIQLDEEYTHKINSNYYNKKFEQIEKKNNVFIKLLEQRLTTLGMYDNSRAEKILNSFIYLLESEEKADLLFTFLENDISKLEQGELSSFFSRTTREQKNLITKKILESMGE